jgi:hypothetical protein
MKLNSFVLYFKIKSDGDICVNIFLDFNGGHFLTAEFDKVYNPEQFI